MKTYTNNIRTIFILCSFFYFLNASAQAPNKMSYQALLRNNSNTLITNQSVGMRVTILRTSITGQEVYKEIFNPNPVTNVNGLVTIEIGSGIPIIGTFASINWSNGPFFVKTETDPLGGTNYSISGTSQLLSVPFALFAATSGSNLNTWNTNGNSSLTDIFLGTANENNVLFIQNSQWAGALSPVKTAFGRNALDTDFGQGNTAIGVNALTTSVGGNDNTATGQSTLFTNTTGSNNTAVGVSALFKNNGTNNTAIGKDALFNNTAGNTNTAIGKDALINNIEGDFNTALGNASLFGANGISANKNTAVGNTALSLVTLGSNNTGLGNEAQVAVANNSNQVCIGNTSVTLASVQVAWTTTSDNRWKSNIQKSNLGLEFIKQLNPVFYTRKDVQDNGGKPIILETTTNPTTEYGFIAQELESTLNKFNAKDNGIISKDDAGMLGVRYNDLLAPMVKAMQEQQVMIEELKAKIIQIENRK